MDGASASACDESESGKVVGEGRPALEKLVGGELRRNKASAATQRPARCSKHRERAGKTLGGGGMVWTCR